MKHHTKHLGDLGVLKAQLDLFNKGYVVCNPLTEHAPFDLVVCKEGKCLTIQVKTRSLTNKGNLEIRFSSSWADKNGNHVSPVDKSLIDRYCVYCPETDTCYYFDPQDFGKSVTLRIDPPKNNQKTNVRLASEFIAL